MRTIKDFFRYIFYRFFQFIFFITPHFLLEKLLRLLTFLAYKFSKKHKKIALANLDLVYGNRISEQRKEEIIYNSFKSLVFNLSEFMENQSNTKEDIFKKADIIGGEIIQKAIDENRKIIYISGHYGIWELGLPCIALKFGNMAIVNRKMDNPHIQKIYEKARSKNQITMIEKKVAAKGMLKAFNDGKKVAVIIDQHIKEGSKVEFLGKKVIATDSTSRLALKFDAVIIPILVTSSDFRKCTIQICEPLDVKKIKFKSENKIDELTQMQADILSKQIYEYPDFWFWQHKRFKKFYKEIYGK